MPTLISFLFRSIPAEFQSDYPLEESVERLRAVVKPFFHNFPLLKEATGKIRQDRVSIRRMTPIGSSFKPSFIGSFHEKAGQVVLSGAFTLHFFTKAILICGLPFIGLMAVLIAIFAAVEGYLPKPEFTIPAFALLPFWLAVECLGQWLSRDDLTWLSTVIRRALSKNADRLQKPYEGRPMDEREETKQLLTDLRNSLHEIVTEAKKIREYFDDCRLLQKRLLFAFIPSLILVLIAMLAIGIVFSNQ
jgi:hypothetical protein